VGFAAPLRAHQARLPRAGNPAQNYEMDGIPYQVISKEAEGEYCFIASAGPDASG